MHAQRQWSPSGCRVLEGDGPAEEDTDTQMECNVGDMAGASDTARRIGDLSGRKEASVRTTRALPASKVVAVPAISVGQGYARVLEGDL